MKPVADIPLADAHVVLVPHAGTVEGAQVVQSLIQCGVRVAACDPNLDAAWQQVISHPGSCAFEWAQSDDLTSSRVIEGILRTYRRLDAVVYFEEDRPLINMICAAIDEQGCFEARLSDDPELSVITGRYGAEAVHIELAA